MSIAHQNTFGFSLMWQDFTAAQPQPSPDMPTLVSKSGSAMTPAFFVRHN
jgi:hypothetical protein